MSYLLSKLLPLFVYPLGSSLLLSGMAWWGWRRWQYVSRALLGLAILWLWIASSPVFSSWLMGMLEKQFPPIAMSQLPEGDVIVLLGGMTRGIVSGTGKADLSGSADRLLYTRELYQAGKAPLILLAGGSAPGYEAEAESMRNILVSLGIPDQVMLLEKASRNTHQNAKFSIPILRSLNAERILLVTSAYHMPRAVKEFSGAGFFIIAAPTDYQVVTNPLTILNWLPQSASLQITTKAMKEYLGQVFLAIRHG
jgi:uncharacterized SAM-binding protein YcdF (DUF218 family)